MCFMIKTKSILRVSCFLIIIYLQIAGVFCQDKNQSPYVLKGTVVSDDGAPLSGVQVSYLGNVSQTDQSGFYRLGLPEIPLSSARIQFRLSGYLITTKIISLSAMSQLDVVMHRGTDPWTPKLCKSVPDRSNRIGWRMKVAIPEGIAVKYDSDVDNSTYKIRYKSANGEETMLMGIGPLWGSVMPPIDRLLPSTTIQEREITWKIWKTAKKGGTDYHMRDQEGRMWRETGYIGESISYWEVSEEAAKFFDSIIDDMCWEP
jgi:hypothetical protein